MTRVTPVRQQPSLIRLPDQRGTLLLEALFALLIFMVGGIGSLTLVLLALRSMSETEVRALAVPEATAWLRGAPPDSGAVVPVRGGLLRWSPEGEGVPLEFLIGGVEERGWPVILAPYGGGGEDAW
jgi:hypothetical protein